MNTRNRLLTAVVLVLAGILIGGILVLWQKGQTRDLHSKVNFTQIKYSDSPYLPDSSLAMVSPRFKFDSIVDRVNPTIVYITSVISLGKSFSELEKGEHNHWYQFPAPKARTVGSGVIISPDGYIVTNAHVIRGALKGKTTVLLSNRRQYEGHIVGMDFLTDLAVIKIDADSLPAITFGNSNKVEVGDWVLAFGNPFNLNHTVTAGIVSAVNRSIKITGELRSKYHITDYIQTDAAINKGNSGGALVNMSGQLIGINTAIASRTGEYQGYGFAIPSNLVKKVAHDLIQYGEVHRALLGVQISSMTYKRAKELGLPRVMGVEVLNVRDSSAAQKSGLEAEDVILAVDGMAVNQANKLQEMIALHHPGDWINVKIWRDGEVLEKHVKLGGLSQSEMLKSVNGQHMY